MPPSLLAQRVSEVENFMENLKLSREMFTFLEEGQRELYKYLKIVEKSTTADLKGV